MYAETKSEVEDILAVFKEDTVVSRLSPDGFGMVLFRCSPAKDSARPRSIGHDAQEGQRHGCQSADTGFLGSFESNGLGVRDRSEADTVAGFDLSHLP